MSASAWAFAQSFVTQPSLTPADLRGISAPGPKVVWASGSKGVYLRTTDGGEHWQVGDVPGAADLDFRGVQAFDADTAFLLSSGPGEKSRIYRTTDGGTSWRPVLVNPDPKGFWDAIAMWDPMHGIVLGDPVNGRFVIYTTSDGVSWQALKGPAANEQEGAFAASNSALFVRGAHEAWFGTGGPGGARVFHTEDGGKSWSAAKTPVRNDSPSAGIFSLAFSDALHGIAVGGDSLHPDETRGAIAITEDGGKSWKLPAVQLSYRSAVEYLRDQKVWIVTGPTGSDISADMKSWTPAGAGYHALGGVWAAGPRGALAKFQP